MAKKTTLLPAIKKLQIASRNTVRSPVLGSYRSVFRGQGLEFEGYRQYNPDDDADMIDWKVSTRTGQLLIKEFVEERNLNVFIMVDVSSSMIFGSHPKLKNEFAAEVAASLCYAILNAGDNVGFALFSDKVLIKSSPVRGQPQFYLFSKYLVDTEYYGGDYDLAGAMKFALTYLKGDSVVIIISDFIGLKGDWKKYTKLVAKKFDLVCISIRDPHDKTLPKEPGNIVIEDPYSDEQLIIDPSVIKEKYEQQVKSDQRMLTNYLHEIGSDYLELDTSRSYITPLMAFFKKRARKFR